MRDRIASWVVMSQETDTREDLELDKSDLHHINMPTLANEHMTEAIDVKSVQWAPSCTRCLAHART